MLCPIAAFKTWTCLSPRIASGAPCLIVRWERLKTEYGAVHHGMDAFVAIDQLGDMQITSKAAKHIALLSGPGLYLRQPLDHVSQSLLGGASSS